MKGTEEEEINRLVEMTPPLPEDFKSWCENQMKRPLIYYRRKGKEAEIKCAACGKTLYAKTADMPEYGTLEIETPRKEHPARCVYCGNQSFYEWMDVKRKELDDKRFYLYQLTEDKKLVIRIFDYNRTSSVDRIMDDSQTEVARFFLEYGQVKKLIRLYTYKGDEYAWCLKKTAGYPYIQVIEGKTFPGWEQTVKESALKYCPLDELVNVVRSHFTQNYKPNVAVIDALMTYANNPAIEMYVKMHMDKLVSRLVWRESIYGAVNRKKRTVNGQLKLKKKENINRLVKEKGDSELLEILQYEEKMEFQWKPEWEDLFRGKWDKNTEKRITRMLKYMTMQQLVNRTWKYTGELTDSAKGKGEFWQTFLEYSDYLRMREELGYDMTNEVFIHPKDLDEKHQEMVKEQNARKDEMTIKKKNKEFANIAKRYESLCKRYQAAADGYIIRPARDAGEIIMEGRILHHCVGGDNYLSSHDKGRSTILFLRSEKKPKKPYITIEIRGTHIVQWYGAHDKKPNEEFFKKYLKDYEDQLEQREKRNDRVLVAAG